MCAQVGYQNRFRVHLKKWKTMLTLRIIAVYCIVSSVRNIVAKMIISISIHLRNVWLGSSERYHFAMTCHCYKYNCTKVGSKLSISTNCLVYFIYPMFIESNSYTCLLLNLIMPIQNDISIAELRYTKSLAWYFTRRYFMELLLRRRMIQHKTALHWL